MCLAAAATFIAGKTAAAPSTLGQVQVHYGSSNGLPDGAVVFFLFAFIIVIGGILVKAIASSPDWTDNSGQPVETVDARLVAKRLDVSGGQHSTSTRYYVTFEYHDGSRQEFDLDGSLYGQLAEGDFGQLTRQGSAFMNFNRVNVIEAEPEIAITPRCPSRRACVPTVVARSRRTP